MTQREEKVLLQGSVIFPIREGENGREVLLAMKTKKIGMGCWNGYGGGTEEGETFEECAVRELEEESTMKSREDDLTKVGIMYFNNTKQDGLEFVAEIHFYLAENCTGNPVETEDGGMKNATWFPISDLPLDKMMPADPEYIPQMLQGDLIVGEAFYGPFQKEILQPTKIELVENFSEYTMQNLK